MRLPCIDCHATGKCACGDCKGETCALCGGTGWLHNIGIEVVAVEMRRLHQRALDAEAEIARLRKELAYQTDRVLEQMQPVPAVKIDPPRLSAELADSVADGCASVVERELRAEIARMREAIGRLPEYRHALSCTTCLLGEDCDCSTDTANAARAEARKEAKLEEQRD